MLMDGNISDNYLFGIGHYHNKEIEEYMNCSPVGNEEDLVAHWTFEEGAGNTAYDSSSNENNGIINRSDI